MTESFSIVNDAGMVVFSPRADFRKKNTQKQQQQQKQVAKRYGYIQSFDIYL